MKLRNFILLGALTLATSSAIVFRDRLGVAWSRVGARFGKRTVADRLKEFGGKARARWQPHLQRAGFSAAPARVVLLVLKEERQLQVYGAGEGQVRWLRAYPVLAASGHLGPKLREGDGQVPEGIYGIELLNPNSAFHVSLRLSYPNDFDREQARKDGRSKLGGDIMIHGKSASVGCIAVGDEAAEDLFTLAADAGIENVVVVLAPVDWRRGAQVPKLPEAPPWMESLHRLVRQMVMSLPAPPP